jgi:hypothetical protein
MATATLTFDLTDPEDSQEHLRCVKATDMALVLWEIRYNLKKRIEHQIDDPANNLTTQDVADNIFDSIYEMMSDKGIVIDNLIT